MCLRCSRWPTSYVHPSLQEGYSNALLEAMAAGKAVVATAVGGNVEAVSDGVTGLLVPPADSVALERAIARLLADRGAARAMGERARRYVRETYEIDRDGPFVRRRLQPACCRALSSAGSR